MAGINLTSNFSVQTNQPLDDRITATNQAARDAISSLRRYEGLKVYVVSDQLTYVLKGGITNGHWATDGGGGSTTPIINSYTGDGTTTAFTLTQDPGTKDNTFVFISGVYQEKSTYSVSGTTITFSTAPTSGRAVQVICGFIFSTIVAADGSVTTAKIVDANVTTAKIADGAITPAKMAAQVYQVSSSCGSFSTSSATYVDVTNLTVTITSTGRPMMLMLQPDGGGSTSGYVGAVRTAIVRDGSQLAFFIHSNTNIINNPGVVYFDAAPSAGSRTYKIQVLSNAGGSINYNNMKLVAYEL